MQKRQAEQTNELRLAETCSLFERWFCAHNYSQRWGRRYSDRPQGVQTYLKLRDRRHIPVGTRPEHATRIKIQQQLQIDADVQVELEIAPATARGRL